MTRWGGTSVGLRTGPRTLCGRCANELDRLRAGGAGRCLMYGLGYVLSAYLGWQLVMHSSVALGLICLLGIPPGVIAWIVEADRRSKIQHDRAELAATPSEVLGRNQDFHDRSETGGGSDPRQFGLQRFAAGESILSWADRLTCDLRAVSGPSPEKFREVLIEHAKYVKPRVGETLDEYMLRAKRWVEDFDHDLDLSSPASAIAPGESLDAWLARTVPIWLTPDQGDCVEEYIENIATAAADSPPQSGETANAWFARFLASIGAQSA